MVTDSDALYVNRNGARGSPHPFACDGLSAYHFWLEGKLENIENLCDRFLNQPSRGAVCYRPLTHYVLLLFNRLRHVSSTDSTFRHAGWASETEAAFFILTGAVRRQAGLSVVDHLAWFIPYIIVDNPLAVTWGREIYGFPKEVGWIDIEQEDRFPLRCAADAMGQRVLSTNSRLSRLRLLEVERLEAGAESGDEGGPGNGAWTNLQSAAREVWQRLSADRSVLVPGLEFAKNTIDTVRSNQFPLVFLKQFFDPADGQRACYQAIVEAPMRLKTFHGGAPLPGRYRFQMYPCESHPIAADLGLVEEQPVLQSYYLDYDVVMDRGRTIWETR